MTLVSGVIRFVRIFAEVAGGGASNDSRVVDNGDFYPRDAMLARVFATATCLSVRVSVCPSACHTPVLCLAERKQDREMYTV